VSSNVETKPTGETSVKAALARTKVPGFVRRAGLTTALAIAMALVIMAIAPWQQSILGTGTIVARSPVDRQQRIDAPVKGRLVRWHVVEGSHVKEGDPIVEISDVDPNYVDRLERRRAATRARIEAAEARSDVYDEQTSAYQRARTLKVKAAALKIQMAEQKVEAARQKVEAAAAEVHTTEVNLVREKRLVKSGLSSQRSLELAELAHNKAVAELNLRRAELSESQASRTALKAERFQVDAEGAAKTQSAAAEARKAGAESAYALEDLAKLEVELSRQDSRIVLAPRDGTILSLGGGLGGKVVSAGEQLATLIPDTDSRAIELWINANDMPLVSEGRHARLQFEGWPAVQFVGWPSVAVGTFGGIVAVVDSSTTRVGQFRVLVVPDPDEPPWPDSFRLRQGLRSKGWVLLDQVPLGWELWRRFNGFPPTVGAAYADNPDKKQTAGDSKKADKL